MSLACTAPRAAAQPGAPGRPVTGATGQSPIRVIAKTGPRLLLRARVHADAEAVLGDGNVHVP